MKRYLGPVSLLAVAFLFLGIQVQCPGAVEARLSLTSLQTEIDALAADVGVITPIEFELVGWSSRACGLEFTGSRMCSSVERVSRISGKSRSDKASF